jgi:prefoldin subunit 5
MAVEVDVSEAVANLQDTIEALEEEISEAQAEFDRATGVKRARLAALKRGLRAAEQAADPDIEPMKRPGRKKAEENVTA